MEAPKQLDKLKVPLVLTIRGRIAQIQLIVAREIQRLEKVQIRGTVTNKYKLSSEGRVEFGAVSRGRGAGSVRGGGGATSRGGQVRGGGGFQPAGQARGGSKF